MQASRLFVIALFLVAPPTAADTDSDDLRPRHRQAPPALRQQRNREAAEPADQKDDEMDLDEGNMNMNPEEMAAQFEEAKKSKEEDEQEDEPAKTTQPQETAEEDEPAKTTRPQEAAEEPAHQQPVATRQKKKASAPRAVPASQDAEAEPRPEPAPAAEPEQASREPREHKVNATQAGSDPALANLRGSLEELKQRRLNAVQLKQAIQSNAALLRESGTLARFSKGQGRAEALAQLKESEDMLRRMEALDQNNRREAASEAYQAAQEATAARKAADALSAEAVAQVRLFSGPGWVSQKAAQAKPQVDAEFISS